MFRVRRMLRTPDTATAPGLAGAAPLLCREGGDGWSRAARLLVVASRRTFDDCSAATTAPLASRSFVLSISGDSSSATAKAADTARA